MIFEPLTFCLKVYACACIYIVLYDIITLISSDKTFWIHQFIRIVNLFNRRFTLKVFNVPFSNSLSLQDCVCKCIYVLCLIVGVYDLAEWEVGLFLSTQWINILSDVGSNQFIINMSIPVTTTEHPTIQFSIRKKECIW